MSLSGSHMNLAVGPRYNTTHGQLPQSVYSTIRVVRIVINTRPNKLENQEGLANGNRDVLGVAVTFSTPEMIVLVKL